jgi:hypothetical protein
VVTLTQIIAGRKVSPKNSSFETHPCTCLIKRTFYETLLIHSTSKAVACRGEAADRLDVYDPDRRMIVEVPSHPCYTQAPNMATTAAVKG